jgi:hypothetical protein
MPTITKVARSILNGAVLIAFTASLAALAADPPAPVPPPPPAAKPVPKPNTHTIIVDGKPKTYFNLPGAQVGGDSSVAYQFRTNILTGKPGCQRFATEADNAFIDDKMDGAAKVALLNKISADAGAAGCLAP